MAIGNELRAIITDGADRAGGLAANAIFNKVQQIVAPA